MDDVHLPGLDLAAKRLGLETAELAESFLSKLDAELDYWLALHSVVAEAAQRRGLYDGETKARIDSGDIFAICPAFIPETPGRMREAIDDGQADVLDALGMAPTIRIAAQTAEAEAEFERRRLAWLEQYEIRPENDEDTGE